MILSIEKIKQDGINPLCTDCGYTLVAVIATTLVECVSCKTQFNLLKIKSNKDKNSLGYSQ